MHGVPITIQNINFAVARQIEQCPKTMMLGDVPIIVEKGGAALLALSR